MLAPLHYLVLTDSAEVLSKLFDQVLVPLTVRDELTHAKVPNKVSEFGFRTQLLSEVGFRTRYFDQNL